MYANECLCDGTCCSVGRAYPKEGRMRTEDGKELFGVPTGRIFDGNTNQAICYVELKDGGYCHLICAKKSDTPVLWKSALV